MAKLLFTPVVGTNDRILSSPPVEGNVWFATDSKKIYYSNGETFLPMGGNSSIFYGTMELADTPDEGQVEFEFSVLEIEGNENITDGHYKVPIIDDLILNQDGCFYRVTEIEGEGEDTVIYTVKLTIAGTGGSTSGGGSSNIGELTYERVTPGTITCLYNQDLQIEFSVSATYASGEISDNGSYSVEINGKKDVIKGTCKQGLNSIEVGSYLGLGENKVRIYVSMDIGGSSFTTQSKLWTITTTQIELNWEYNKETDVNYTDTPFDLKWSVSGYQIEKTTHIIIDDYFLLPEQVSTSTAEQSISIAPDDWNLTHGAHKIEIYVTANVGGTNVRTNPIIKSLIFAERTNENPIINCNFFDTEVTQYNTIKIPFIFYQKDNGVGNLTAVLKENGTVVDTWKNIKNSEVKEWNYTPIETTTRNLTVQCGVVEKTLILEVDPLNIDNEEISGYAFRFKASDFASNNAVQNWNSNGITAEFSDNFDWINGGLKSEKDDKGNTRQYLCVKAGSTMTIDYQLFNTPATVRGKAFKFIFKANSCRDYDALVLNCYDDDKEIGLKMQAQHALLKGSENAIQIPYCENSYIEFEFDISQIHNVKRYMIPWLDGVPAALVQYSSTEQFVHNQKIVIGSDDCDVYVYMIKLYENHLDNESHLQNFIADAPNAQEMLDRFNRNDIIDPERGVISPTLLAEKNPNCRVHIYDIERMTLSKDDKIDGCTYKQYHGSDEPVLTADNVQIRVQGTSSAAYGLSAFNIDSKFNDGFVHADGTKTEGWSMNPDSIPVNYLCTKVNVASCEHANNALNQEWYNRYQPYKTALRRKNPNARDCMEFVPGVLFIKDHNTQKDFETTSNFISNNLFAEIDGYIDNPYERMYSICNMGNSKKNSEVLHDTENPLEYCVEVADNQTAWQWMTNNNYSDSTIWKNPEGFEFRYPDDGHVELDNTEAIYDSPLTGEKVTHRQHAFDSWRRFMNWMAQSNPQPAYKEITINSIEEFNAIENDIYTAPYDESGLTGVHTLITEYDPDKKYYLKTTNIFGYTLEPLSEPVTYGNYEFRQGSPYTATLTKGGTCIITAYAGEYTHDTYEYRMAKMLNECENYLVMDSVLYHYLFIERHTMVDNVAKNTFWSTEDGYHWNLTKNYDNDTSDGNDNQGKLTLTYGIEPFDTHPDDATDYYFNADQSVWFRFCGGLYEACQVLYRALENTGENGKENVWSSDAYLKAFNDWQKAIPERCWIEDYYRKYIRPLEIYGDSMYVDMLEGGQKVHQRKQFETYQDDYMASKYVGNAAVKNRIIIRGEGERFTPGLPVSVYADGYIQAAFGYGSDKPNVSIRVKRNEPITIHVPDSQANLTNATIYFFSPQLYQTIGEEGRSLNIFLPKQITVSPAEKLRELIAGDYEEASSNLINYGLEEVGFDNNIMLEKLHICNYPNTELSLDLTKAVNLKELDARNSGFTGISIANGAPITKIQLEKPGTLNLSNLRYLETLTLNHPEELRYLLIDNIDTNENGINSKDDIIDIANNLTSYKLLNVLWKIDNEEEINNNQNQINVLEKILELTPYSAPTQLTPSISADSLTGILELNTKVDNPLEIYERYAIELNQNDQRRFPNLDIIFNHSDNTLYNVFIADGNDNIIWKRKLLPGEDIDDDFLSDGPLGSFDVNKIKQSSTEYYDYAFSNSWRIYDADTGEYINQYAGAIPLINNITQNIKLVPQFTQTVRQWNISLWNDDVELFSGTCDAGTNLQEYINTNYPIIPYKDDRSLDLRSTYSFEGYALSKTATSGINASRHEITSNMVLYAIFKEISVYDNVHEDYWDYTLINNNAYGTNYDDNDNSYHIASGYVVMPKANKGLKGKLTVPDVYNNLPVFKLGNEAFFDNTEITHIFVKGNNLRIVGESCFSATRFANDGTENNALKYFDFKDGLRRIERYAFQFTRLEPINGVMNFGNNIFYIGPFAFNQCFNLLNAPCMFNISSSLTTFGQYALSYFKHNVSSNNTIYIGRPDEGSNLNLSMISGATENYHIIIGASANQISEVTFYSKLYSSSDETVATNAGSYSVGHLLGLESTGVSLVTVIPTN